MRVLIVSEDQGWRAAATVALRSADVTTSDVGLAGASACIAASAPDALVFRWPAVGGIAALHAACGADRCGAMYVLVELPDGSRRELAKVIAAGAHDVVRERYFLDEVRERIDAKCRLLRWMRAVEAREPPDRNTLETLRAWRHLGEVVVDELEAMLGCALELDESNASAERAGLHGAAVVLTLAAERFDLRVRVASDAASIAAIGALLLGEPVTDAAAQADILREMTNAASGAIKRAALPEHITLTLGLPRDCEALGSTSSRCWVAKCANVEVVLSAELRLRENEKVPAARLREGMVVVKDVRGTSGMLLVSGGTRLTMTTAVRLAGMLGERTLVEVADAA